MRNYEVNKEKVRKRGITNITNAGRDIPINPDSLSFTDKFIDYAVHVYEIEYVPANDNPPVIGPIGDRSINEGTSLAFTVSATDPDGDAITYSATGLPTGASFDPSTHIFTWTPDYTQAGVYTVTFTASDGNLSASQNVVITVANINLPPIIDPIGDKTVAEGSALSFVISATDPDGNTITYLATGLPQGATFDPNTRTFSWTPDYTQSGTYTVTFTASDGSLFSSQDVKITVAKTNMPPVIDPIGNKTVSEGSTLSFVISATDPNRDTLTYLLQAYLRVQALIKQRTHSAGHLITPRLELTQ